MEKNSEIKINKAINTQFIIGATLVMAVVIGYPKLSIFNLIVGSIIGFIFGYLVRPYDKEGKPRY